MRKAAFVTSWLILSTLFCVPSRGQKPWDDISKALGVPGTMQPGGVYKVAIPRTDFSVRRGEVRIAPTLGLTSWVAFRAEGGQTIAHGDLCLREEEVNPVLSRLQQGGMEATALHNHLGGENPRVIFLHFWGHGEAASLARTLRAAIDLTGGIPKPPKPVEGTLEQASLEKILGGSGRLTAGVLQFSFPRDFPISMHGFELPPAMGMATAINFQPTATGAAATGDFVLREQELAPLLKALRHHDIEVTAVHNHMIYDEPRLLFVHFWGEGAPPELAGALRAALDAVLSTSPTAPTQSRRWDFEDATPGRVPDYIDARRGRWEVKEIEDAPLGPKVLVQVAQSSRPYFNLAVVKEEKFLDLRLTVKVKPLSGFVDQGGGLVWRYRDADNYYLARVNPLEHDFRVYRVVNGKRELFRKAEVSAEAGRWHTMSVTMRGDQIVCELNGRKYLETQDGTFKDEGLVGLWTKADAITAFDELQVESFETAGSR